MKKIIAIISVLLMLFSASVSAATLTAEKSYNAEKNAFKVFGYSDDVKVNDNVIVEAYLDNVIFDTVMTRTFKKDGQTYYETDYIPVDSQKPTGQIVFKVYTTYGSNSAQTAPHNYYGVSDLYAILQNIDSYAPSNYASFKNEIVTNASKLSVDGGIINGFTEKGNRVSAEYAKTISLELPASVVGDENVDKVFEELIKFRKEYRNLCMVGEFAEINSKDKFLSWYGKYSDVLEMELYKPLLKAYFTNNYTSDVYYSILSAGSMGISDITKLKERLLEVGGLTVVKNGNATNVKQVSTDFSYKITKTVTISEILETNVFVQMAGSLFADFNAFSSKYNELASPGDGGGLGGTPSPSPSPSVKIDKSDEILKIEAPSESTSVENNEAFADMKDAAWAREAVYSLYDKKIISGKTATEFKPNDNITRAEFVKLLVLMNEEPLDANDQIFSDVKASDWYFKYVNKAYQLGIVLGDTSGNFNPNAQITRQDIATMVYRLIGNDTVKGDLSIFSDGVEVSDYAKDAVSYLSAEGIVNGMGNGIFAPKAKATRAQAAQIIYNIIK